MKPEDLIPAVKPAYGAETARVVLDIITTFPDQHDQSIWGASDYDCGTVCCIAGWARRVHDAEHTHGFDYGFSTPGIAIEVLGLDAHTARMLFHHTTEAQAARALEFLAKGDPIDWDEVEKVTS